MKPVAAFVDRDGVINEEHGYVSRPADFVLLPGAVNGLAMLQAAGFRLVVITNQAGIARGLYTEDDFLILSEHMRNLLAKQGVIIDEVYYSPYHPIHGLGRYRVDSDCRKPKPGMILRARDELGIDLAHSILIGDKQSDIEAGRSACLGSCLLVRSGHAITEEDIFSADACFDNLEDAARWAVVHQCYYRKNYLENSLL